MVREILRIHPDYVPAFRPEAMGVNVSLTMKNAGLILEWPPRNIVHKIAFIGVLKK